MFPRFRKRGAAEAKTVVPRALRISCITRSHRAPAQEQILYVGGMNPDLSAWKLDELDAIVAIENGIYAFYVEVDGRTLGVVVGSASGRKYLKTTDDELAPDTLLRLNECR